MTGADGYFDERIAATYDELSADMFDPVVVEPTVDFIASLAGDGRALELGIGTGRIAVPLAARGIPVRGIELSRAMAARLRAKPGGEGIGVTIGDFATAKAEGTFRLAYLVFNTISNLTTQAAQVACFQNVAAHLEPGGCFVIEVGVPGLRHLPPARRSTPTTSARPAGHSTSTTSRTRDSSRTISGSSTAGWIGGRSRSSY
jgi:SAM-dependent methyltransferase